jgi:transposase-like protein
VIPCAERKDVTMNLKRRVFSKEFKLHVVSEVRSGRSQAGIARQYQVLPKMISRWLTEYRTYADEAFAGCGNAYTDKARMAALERKITRLEAENDLLKKALTQLDLVHGSVDEPGESA